VPPQLATDTFTKLEAEVIETDPVARRLVHAAQPAGFSPVWETQLRLETAKYPAKLPPSLANTKVTAERTVAVQMAVAECFSEIALKCSQASPGS
jgi:hypothetical protein